MMRNDYKTEDAIADLKVLKDFFEQESGAYPISLEYAINMLEKELLKERRA